MAKLRVDRHWELRIGSLLVERLFNKDYREVVDPAKAAHASIIDVREGGTISAWIVIKKGDVFTYTRTKGKKRG